LETHSDDIGNRPQPTGSRDPTDTDPGLQTIGASRPVLRAAWLRPRQTHLIATASKHFWTGGLETAGPGCYDAVAIARTAGFRVLVMSRIRPAVIVA
jgi:hypothetical protein